eukprot:374746_1
MYNSILFGNNANAFLVIIPSAQNPPIQNQSIQSIHIPTIQQTSRSISPWPMGSSTPQPHLSQPFYPSHTQNVFLQATAPTFSTNIQNAVIRPAANTSAIHTTAVSKNARIRTSNTPPSLPVPPLPA